MILFPQTLETGSNGDKICSKLAVFPLFLVVGLLFNGEVKVVSIFSTKKQTSTFHKNIAHSQNISKINLGPHVLTATWHVFHSLWVNICTVELSKTGTPSPAPQDRFSDEASFLSMEISIVFVLWVHCLCGQRALVQPAQDDSTESKTQHIYSKFTQHDYVAVWIGADLNFYAYIYVKYFFPFNRQTHCTVTQLSVGWVTQVKYSHLRVIDTTLTFALVIIFWIDR